MSALTPHFRRLQRWRPARRSALVSAACSRAPRVRTEVPLQASVTDHAVGRLELRIAEWIYAARQVAAIATTSPGLPKTDQGNACEKP